MSGGKEGQKRFGSFIYFHSSSFLQTVCDPHPLNIYLFSMYKDKTFGQDSLRHLRCERAPTTGNDASQQQLVHFYKTHRKRHLCIYRFQTGAVSSYKDTLHCNIF